MEVPVIRVHFLLSFYKALLRTLDYIPCCFPFLLLHTLTRPPPRASFFPGWTTLTLYLSTYVRCRSLHYLLVLLWAPEKLWNWTHIPPVQLRNHKCTCRYKGGTYLWRLLCHGPQCHHIFKKNSVVHYKALHHHIQWCIQVFPRETQSKGVKVIKFHAKNRHYYKLRLRFLKG